MFGWHVRVAQWEKMKNVKRLCCLLLVCVLWMDVTWGKSQATSRRVAKLQAQHIETGAAPATSSAAAVGWFQHSISLTDLGLNEPIVLGGSQTTRTLYFPVPSKMPVTDVQWEIPYQVVGLRKSGALLSVFVNERLVLREELSSQVGSYRVKGVLEKIDTSGFLRIRIQLDGTGSQGRSDDNTCEAPATVVLDTSMGIKFRYHPERLATIGDIWTLLPVNPTVLLPPNPLPLATYQSAFRVGAAFASIEKRAVFESLPTVKDTVDTAQLTVPTIWQDIPAFRALAARDKHVLVDKAELTAWVLLRLQRAPLPAVIVVDAALLRNLQQGLDALVAQVQTVRRESGRTFNEWMAAQLARVLQGRSEQRVLLQPTDAGGILVVGPNASVAFGQMFESRWALLMRASGSSWGLQPDPPAGSAEIRFKDVGLPIGPVTFTDRLEWGARFELGQSAFAGRVPSEVVMDLVLPDMHQDRNPIARLYFNDMLLTGGVLPFDKQTTHQLRARIPASAVQGDNGLTLVVDFAVPKADCTSPPLTVGVQGTSHLVLATTRLAKNFNGVGYAMASGGHVFVPARYLGEPGISLPNLIWAARALSLNASQVAIGVLPTGEPTEWPVPFLAWDVPDSTVEAFRSSNLPNVVADSFGTLGNGLSARVVNVKGETSVLMRVHGRGLDESPVFAKFRHGSVALVEGGGRLVEWDDAGLTREAYLDELRQPWVVRNVGWWLPAALVLGFVGMLVVASVIRRGKR